MSQPQPQQLPLLIVNGDRSYEELHRMLHDNGMRCNDPQDFLQDMFGILRTKSSVTAELPEFIQDVCAGTYVDHYNHYTRFGGDLEEFSKNILSQLALDARNSLLHIYNELRAGGYYNKDGSFPYVLHKFTNRAISFRPLY